MNRCFESLLPAPALTQRKGADYSYCANSESVLLIAGSRSRSDRDVHCKRRAHSHMQQQLIRELVALLGPKAVLSQRDDLMLYEYDGSVELGSPECIVFPTSTREVAEIARLANRFETPIVGRGPARVFRGVRLRGAAASWWPSRA